MVDDDRDILEVVGLVLEADGLAHELMDHLPSVEEIRRLDPVLILLDVRLTGSHRKGTEFCRDLKSQGPAHVPVLLFSSEHDLSGLAEQCGADGFVTKPFDIPELLYRIREFVS